nr:hypothetical protein [Tanacetum cinerariifolium]
DINIDALYNILKQNQGDVKDVIGSKKKTIVVTSDPLALIAEKTKVSKSKEKVVVSLDFKGSKADDFSELKKITALLAKAFNRRKFYSKPTNNNLRTSYTSQSANKKQEFVKTHDKKVEKKADEKKRDMSRVKCYNCKKKDILSKTARKQSDSDQEINANMVFMAQIEKVLFDSEASLSSADEKISQNGDQPLPRVTQVSIAGTSSTEQPPLKDKSMWSDQEKRIQKIDRLARSLLIQGLPNDIYSLIDSNKATKDLWDALARHMLGSEYGEQNRKAAVLYEYETFKATKGELLLDTYIRYLQVINDLKKCGYSKDNCELNFKFLNNLQPEWKQYATIMRQNKNLMDINIDALYNILKQNQGDVNDAMGLKKKIVVVNSNPLALIVEKMKVSKSKEKVVVFSDFEGSEADDFSELKKITALLAKVFNRRKFYSKPTNNNLRTSSTSQVKCYNCKKEGHFTKDYKKVKVKDYEYYKIKMLLAKKNKDEQVLLAEDQAWMESSSDSDQEKNTNMVFMAQIEKVLSDLEASSSSVNEKISEVSYYLFESESESEFETLEYYDNPTNYGLVVNNDDDQEIFHDAIESASENFIENHIDSQKDYDKSDIDHNDSEEKDHLVDKLKRVEKANQQSKDFENQNKDLQDKYDVLKNQTTIFEMNNKELNEQLKELIEKNDDLLAQTKVLKDQLQVKHVVIDHHAECQEKYAKLEAKRYEYLIRYSAYFDNDKQHR